MIGLAQVAPLFIASMALGGVSAGVLLAVLPAVVVGNAPADSVGIASALFNTSRTAAGAAAGAVFALVMTVFMTTSPSIEGSAVPRSTPLSFFAVWAICLVISLVLAVVGTRVRVVAAGEPALDRAVSPVAAPTPGAQRIEG
jgi:MFS family permease